MAEGWDVRLSAEAFDPASELAAFTNTIDPEQGAVASFIGLCRASAQDGATLEALVLESYRGLTLRSMQDIAADAARRFGVERGCIVHRSGRVPPGAPIVLVATAAPHRRAAIACMDYAMDRLKSDAIFWKREESAKGSRWIEPSAKDLEDKARWQGET